ncbi:hypothetical protein AXF42_Ash000265 [Apostasia shenzhenica]|uniref:RING-type E3 ubiquitin transferase n=1 Tax=Apostasia shenzhenica TaxID=1088818 RepID=A0A2I0AFU9_9ASPA|nr:hypothetical protein AXF42_Ash000265 [Apostasia shenzhenica]
MAATLSLSSSLPSVMTWFSRGSSFSVFLLLVLFILRPSPSSASSPTKVSYAEHCGSIVPQSTSTGVFISPSDSFQISSGYYTGGKQLFAAANQSSAPQPELIGVGSFQFNARFIHRTQSAGTLQISGSLSIVGHSFKYTERRPRHHRQGLHSSVVFSGTSVFFDDLSGFWSESTEELCMVGTGSSYFYEAKVIKYFSVVFKLHYPKISNISTSLVSGTVESIGPVGNPNYFDKVSILAYAPRNNYSYTQLNKVRDSCALLNVSSGTRKFETGSLCSYISNLLRGNYRFEEGVHPFSGLNDYSLNFLSFNEVYCSKEDELHMRIGISNSSFHWYETPLKPENSLVAEGFWDNKNHRICLAACRINTTKNALEIASVDDCSIRLTLWFPRVLSIKNRSKVVGRMWSDKDKNEPDYFSMASFRDLGDHLRVYTGMIYEYTRLDDARKLYDSMKSHSKSQNKTYPDENSKRDLSFSISLSRGNSSGSGRANLISFADTLYVDSFLEQPQAADVYEWNVSYGIYYRNHSNSSSSTMISAEGLYNSRTGLLCMVGCMYPTFSSPIKQDHKTEDSMDCSIVLNFQLPPMNPEAGELLNGTIKSIREPSDPLYFEPLSVSSYHMYESQAAKLMWRMDIEFIMIIISLTLSCIIIRWQILYTRKHREVLSAISLTMLVLMIVGYLIPLILNFESLLIMVRNKQNTFIRSNEWIVVKEAVERVLTLTAFLFHLRLLQVSWSADEGRNDLRVAERKTFMLCLILYFVGAVIAWFVLSRNKSNMWEWEDLLPYAGLILDAFLLPQIVINIFRNSKEKALSIPYYVGMTAIRTIPHLYDLFRSHLFVPYFQSVYNIYASREVEYYSSLWDTIIPSTGVLFATTIFLQQRFGGNCILPTRYRKHDGYATIAELNL